MQFEQHELEALWAAAGSQHDPCSCDICAKEAEIGMAALAKCLSNLPDRSVTATSGVVNLGACPFSSSGLEYRITYRGVEVKTGGSWGKSFSFTESAKYQKWVLERLGELHKISDGAFKIFVVESDDEDSSSFRCELKELLSAHSKGGDSDTSDQILADYLLQCLHAFTNATNRRDSKL